MLPSLELLMNKSGADRTWEPTTARAKQSDVEINEFKPSLVLHDHEGPSAVHMAGFHLASRRNDGLNIQRKCSGLE